MATSGILVTQFDTAKLFLGNCRYKTASYTNSTGDSVTLTEGMLLGRIKADGKVKQSVSTATDGSQLPIGVLRGTQTVANGATVTLTYAVWGDMARELIVFGGSDTYTTNLYVAGPTDSPADTDGTFVGTVEDYLLMRGIYLEAGTENTKADNA